MDANMDPSYNDEFLFYKKKKLNYFLWFFAFTFKNENYNGAMILKKVEIFFNDWMTYSHNSKIIKYWKYTKSKT